MLYQVLGRRVWLLGEKHNQPYVELHEFSCDEEAVEWTSDLSVEMDVVIYRLQVGHPPVVVYVRKAIQEN